MNNSESNNIFHLTQSQLGIYFECMENPESTAYNNPFVVELPKTVDLDKFEKAVRDTAFAHPALFVNVCMKNGEPVMIEGKKECNVLRTKGSIEAAKASFIKPYDLKNDILFRFEICEDEEKNAFLLDVHHVVFDGSSLKIMLDNIFDCYSGKEITNETRTIFEASEIEKELMNSEEYKKAQDYFRNMLGGRSFNCDLIGDRKEKGTGFSTIFIPAPSELNYETVKAFSKKNEITVATFYTAAFAYALSVFTGSDEACFATVSSGRHCINLPDAIGMFAKTLPLCIDIPEKENTAEFLRNFKKTFHGAVRNEIISFSELASEYGATPKISFAYQGDILSGFEIENEAVSAVNIAQISPSDILCFVLKNGNSFDMMIQYSNELYTENLVKNLGESVFEIAEGMMTAESLCDIQLVSPCQKKFIDEFNNTDRDYPTDLTVNTFFDEAVKKHPGNTALVFKDKIYNYSEFEAVTGRIAGYISSQGIQPEEFVAVLAPRDDFAVLSAWGIIRSGAAFQMLDSTYPPERINYMLSDSKANLLIADRNLIHLIEGYAGKVLFTDEIDTLPVCERPSAEIKPENAITMIYTSGTTGKPKGSVLENRNLAAFFLNHVETMKIDESSRLASYASFGFDAGIMDIISAISAGAGMYIVPDEIRLDMVDVEKFYISNGITHGFMTTQVGRMFAEITKCKTLKAFMVGGEKLVPFKVQDGFDFINGYGPCETMAYVCHQVVRDNSLLQPIGKPSGNIKLFVADKHGRLLPPGGVGELCISGTQVGRGYLGLPEKTAEVFVKNPYCQDKKYSRMYKSGDIVRLLPSGEIDYVGRRDGQVKIRGFRVELTEIEEVIRRFEGVSDATVAAFDEASGGKYIAAYVTGENPINIEALHKFIGSEKPAYMVPKVTMQIDAIPYNQNQKVNRRALPVPEIKRTRSEITKPETEMQRVIYAFASSIIGSKDFGIESDLFECGMTSIGLLRFNSLLSEELNVDISISDIRKNSNIKAIATLAEAAKTAEEFTALDDYPLMKNQAGVYLDSLRDENSLIYNIPVLFRIDSEVETEKLREAVCKAINAHSYIKATLKANEKGDIRVIRNDDSAAEVSVIEIEALPLQEEIIRPFMLIGGRLYRAEIYITPAEKYLFIDVHHILSDGVSLAVLINDINLAYEGKEPQNERFSGFDESVYEESIDEGVLSAQKEYYKNLLNGCDGDCLPEFQPESNKEESGEFFFDIENSAAVTDCCTRLRVSPNAFFNSAFAYTLATLLHTDDVTYCTIYNGRNNPRLDRCFAMLVKTLPVRCRIADYGSVSELVAGMQNQILDTMSNDSVPYMDVASAYGLKPDIFFNYQGDNFIFDSICGHKAETMDIDIIPAKAPLTIEVFAEGGIYKVKISYRKNCYDRNFASSLAENLAENAEEFAKSNRLVAIQTEKKQKIKTTSSGNGVSKSAGQKDKQIENRIREIFASVLGIEEIDANDSFFEIGGTSLSASKVTMMLMSESIEVKYGDIFANPSPSALAEFIWARDNADKISASPEKASETTTRDALKWNMTKYANKVKRTSLGNVLLTGAVGFLGIHILKELLEIEDGHIYCLVRKGSFDSCEIRLRAMLFYYFSNGFDDVIRERVSLIDADITDEALADVLCDVPFDTVINCAACVKHFADDDIIERINVKGVENLIDICKKRDKKLIQISTVSVPGLHTEESYEKQVKMHENELFVIDDMENKYGISKYHAELKMFDAIEGGMRGKVIRAGNLMGRHSDGEFQINFESNMFFSGIRGFAVMGKYPVSHMTDPMRFSPVDCTARAMVLLAGTNDIFTAFNCDNRYGFDEMKVIDACNRNGIIILPEEDEAYYAEFRQKLGDEKLNSMLNGLAAYDIPGKHPVETDNLFTTNILYRIGFSWPLVDDAYLDRAIGNINALDYFDVDKLQED